MRLERVRIGASGIVTFRCSQCKEYKHRYDFHMDSKAKYKIKEMCIVCFQSRKALRLKHPEYDKMFLKQKGRCKICGERVKKYRLSLDHCHKTGKIRGLLCNNCNLALGNFKDNVRFLKKAIKYLNDSSKKRN